MNKTLNFFFEIGQLNKVKHAGWYLAGIKNPENVAEHVFRASQIAFILAMHENIDPYKTAMMVLFHDNGEARVMDAHRVASRYLETKEGEKNAAQEQFETLPEKISEEIKALYLDFEDRKSPEAICAKDADYLDQAICAREYIETGYAACQDWINNIKKALKTETAKKWILEIEKADPTDWWHGLKKIPKD
jgi:putative hydrolase of HD superfamily